MATNERTVALRGWAAMFATVLLWASFALSSRAIGESSLGAIDAAFIRFVTPLVLLSPRIPRVLRAVRQERRGPLILLLAGGLPHFLAFAYGAHLTSATLTGMLVPGTVPLFATALGLLADRRTPVSRRRVLGLAAIGAGVAVSTLLIGPGSGTGGIALLLLAGLAWAVYTMGLQRSVMSPLDVAVAVCGASSLACVLLGMAGVVSSRLAAGTANVHDVVLIVGVQGIGTGILSTLCYAYAVRLLGSTLASVGGAASPVLTAFLAIPIFAEGLSPGLGAALALIVVGVVVYNLASSSDSRQSTTTSHRSRVRARPCPTPMQSAATPKPPPA